MVYCIPYLSTLLEMNAGMAKPACHEVTVIQPLHVQLRKKRPTLAGH